MKVIKKVLVSIFVLSLLAPQAVLAADAPSAEVEQMVAKLHEVRHTLYKSMTNSEWAAMVNGYATLLKGELSKIYPKHIVDETIKFFTDRATNPTPKEIVTVPAHGPNPPPPAELALARTGKKIFKNGAWVNEVVTVQSVREIVPALKVAGKLFVVLAVVGAISDVAHAKTLKEAGIKTTENAASFATFGGYDIVKETAIEMSETLPGLEGTLRKLGQDPSLAGSYLAMASQAKLNDPVALKKRAMQEQMGKMMYGSNYTLPADTSSVR